MTRFVRLPKNDMNHKVWKWKVGMGSRTWMNDRWFLAGHLWTLTDHLIRPFMNMTVKFY